MLSTRKSSCSSNAFLVITSTVPLIPPASISAVGDFITLTAEITSEAIVPNENPLSASGAAKS